MDFSRLRQGEIVAGIGGIALIVFLFFDWFEGTSGWSAYGGDVTGFIIALAGFTAVKFTGLAAMGKRLNIPVPRGGITLVLGTLAVLIIIWSIFVTEGEDIKFGLFLGLAAAVAIAVGALMALREGGWEPLVDAGGSATHEHGDHRDHREHRDDAPRRVVRARAPRSPPRSPPREEDGREEARRKALGELRS